MQLITRRVGKCGDKGLVIAPVGDIQWTGKSGVTAKESLKRHIGECLELGAWFVGMGDYIDLMSPSNRQRLRAAGLYDTALEVMRDKAMELTHEVFEEFFKDTKGRWLGLVEGHHFFEADGETSDEEFARLVDSPFLGTSAFIRVEPVGVVLWVHHGNGGGVMPGSGMNKLYHVAAGLEGADVYLFGHNTKLITARLSRPYPNWQDAKNPMLIHRDIWLVNTGGFARSNVEGHRVGALVRGDYAEQGLMTPSPLSAPIITVKPRPKPQQPEIRVAV